MCDREVQQLYNAAKPIIKAIDEKERICQDYESFCWMYGVIICNQIRSVTSSQSHDGVGGRRGYALYLEMGGWERSCQRNILHSQFNSIAEARGTMTVRATRDINKGDPVSKNYSRATLVGDICFTPFCHRTYLIKCR